MSENTTCRSDHKTCRNRTCVNRPEKQTKRSRKHVGKGQKNKRNKAENMSENKTCRRDHKTCRNRTCVNRPEEETKGAENRSEIKTCRSDPSSKHHLKYAAPVVSFHVGPKQNRAARDDPMTTSLTALSLLTKRVQITKIELEIELD